MVLQLHAAVAVAQEHGLEEIQPVAQAAEPLGQREMVIAQVRDPVRQTLEVVVVEQEQMGSMVEVAVQE
jgi:hypothetical protein